jgi:hypothetical protein
MVFEGLEEGESEGLMCHLRCCVSIIETGSSDVIGGRKWVSRHIASRLSQKKKRGEWRRGEKEVGR